LARKKKNITLEKVLIEDYAAEGRSLARVEGKVIFVEQVVPGDVVDVRLTKNKKDWAEGWPAYFHSLSEKRVTPFCQHFGTCGGCQWQMLPYDLQLQYKQKQVQDNLRRIGKVQLPEMFPILGAKQITLYRNKIEYTFGTDAFLTKEEFAKKRQETTSPPHILSKGEGEISSVAGFHAKGFWDKVVDIETCHLQAEPTNEIRLAIKDFSIQNHWPFYNLRQQHGFLRTMQVRLCETGEWMANVVVGNADMEKIEKLMQHLLQRFPQITSLLYTINTKRNDSLHDLEPVVYHGKGYVVEKMEDFQFKIGPKSFF